MKKPYFVAVAGPSGSGKSTACKRIKNDFDSVERIKLDDYFKDPDTFPVFEGNPNWDLPECINFTRLYDDLKNLKQGRTVEGLSFDKVTLKRTTRKIDPCDTVLVEGFLVLHEKKIRDLMDLIIYVGASDETLFKRRMGRGSSQEEEYVKKVVMPNYKKYVLPAKKYADYFVDGEGSEEAVYMKLADVAGVNG